MEGFDPSAFLAKRSSSTTGSSDWTGVTTVNVRSSEEHQDIEEETGDSRQSSPDRGSEVILANCSKEAASEDTALSRLFHYKITWSREDFVGFYFVVNDSTKFISRIHSSHSSPGATDLLNLVVLFVLNVFVTDD